MGLIPPVHQGVSGGEVLPGLQDRSHLRGEYDRLSLRCSWVLNPERTWSTTRKEAVCWQLPHFLCPWGRSAASTSTDSNIVVAPPAPLTLVLTRGTQGTSNIQLSTIAKLLRKDF